MTYMPILSYMAEALQQTQTLSLCFTHPPITPDGMFFDWLNSRTSGHKHRLSFARGAGHDFDVLLSFPGPRRPLYPLAPYPIIAEFRAMLAALTPKGRPRQHWDGEHFYGYVIERGNEPSSGSAPMPMQSRSAFRSRSGKRYGICFAGFGRCRKSAWPGTH